MRSILKARSQIVFSCSASSYSRTIEATIATMHKCSFKNQKQLTTWFVRVPRNHKFKVRVQTLLMAHAKTVALITKNRFGVAPKDESSSCLRKCNIEMRTQPAIDRSELLSNELRNIDLRLAWWSLLARRQFKPDSHGSLSIAVGLHGTKKTILGPTGYVSESESRIGRYPIVIRRPGERRFDFQLQAWRRSVGNTQIEDLTINLQSSEVLFDEVNTRRHRATLINS